MNSRTNLLPWVLLASLTLAACSEASDPTVNIADAVDPSQAAEPSEAAEAVAPGLIRDPLFALAGESMPLQHWRLYQHAGDASYAMEIQQGEVRIKRIGVEPWGSIEQTLSADAWVGKTLEWSAELSGELGESRGEAFDASGLSVTVMGFGPSDLPMMGARHLLTLTSEPPLSTGPVAPQRYRIRFVVPEGRELELKVAVQLTRDGELRMRAPSLQVIEEPAAP